MKNEKKKKEVTLNIIIKLNYTDWECKKENILKKKKWKEQNNKKKGKLLYKQNHNLEKRGTHPRL